MMSGRQNLSMYKENYQKRFLIIKLLVILTVYNNYIFVGTVIIFVGTFYIHSDSIFEEYNILTIVTMLYSVSLEFIPPKFFYYLTSISQSHPVNYLK